MLNFPYVVKGNDLHKWLTRGFQLNFKNSSASPATSWKVLLSPHLSMCNNVLFWLICFFFVLTGLFYFWSYRGTEHLLCVFKPLGSEYFPYAYCGKGRGNSSERVLDSCYSDTSSMASPGKLLENQTNLGSPPQIYWKGICILTRSPNEANANSSLRSTALEHIIPPCSGISLPGYPPT